MTAWEAVAALAGKLPAQNTGGRYENLFCSGLSALLPMYICVFHLSSVFRAPKL